MTDEAIVRNTWIEVTVNQYGRVFTVWSGGYIKLGDNFREAANFTLDNINEPSFKRLFK